MENRGYVLRARGRDIVELFGYSPDDLSEAAKQAFSNSHCPFSETKCSKTNHDQSVVYGVCSVTNGMQTGPHDEVMICPKRLYQKENAIFQDLVTEVWGEGTDLIIGGTVDSLRERALKLARPAVAFGQASGTEIAVNSNGQMSMDWVIQTYHTQGGLRPDQFIGIEVQSIDTTGNYRDNWNSYSNLKTKGVLPKGAVEAAESGHGLNWANVHKRLIPQIIRKGNIYRDSKRCVGFYFILPEIVYTKFEEVIGEIPELEGPANDRLSIKTYSLAAPSGHGSIRDICPVKTKHFELLAVAQAFISNMEQGASSRLDTRLKDIL